MIIKNVANSDITVLFETSKITFPNTNKTVNYTVTPTTSGRLVQEVHLSASMSSQDLT